MNRVERQAFQDLVSASRQALELLDILARGQGDTALKLQRAISVADAILTDDSWQSARRRKVEVA